MRKLAGNIFLFFAVAIITIAVLETTLQFVYPAHGSWRLFHVPDPKLGWVLKPGASFYRQLPGDFVRVSYNAEGYRDHEFDDPRDAGATRVVVLGDSYMEANMVPLEEVFHKQFERLAQKDDRTLATYNLGVAHYGTLQEYLAFERSGVKLKPDLVLLAFYLQNDVRNNSEGLNVGAAAQRGGRKRPFLAEDNGGTWQVHDPDFEVLQRRYLKQQGSLAFKLKHRSVLITLLHSARNAFESPEDYFRDGLTLGMHRCKIPDNIETGWRTTERILAHLRDAVAKTGARLVVFSVPSLVESDMRLAGELDESAKAHGLELCVTNSPGYRRLEGILETQGIPYIDLVPDFRRATSDEGRNLFVRGDWHWNGEGHELAAEKVYAALKQRGLMPK